MTEFTSTDFELVPSATADSFNDFVAYARRQPILEPEEERDLLARLKEHDDPTAAEKLLTSHLRLVIHYAYEYRGYNVPLADLVQEGNIGLMKALKAYDVTKSNGARFGTFAIYFIKSEMNEFIYRNQRITRVVSTKAQRKLFFNLRRHKPEFGWLTEDQKRVIAADLKVDVADVTDMEAKMYGFDVGFDVPVARGTLDEDASRTFGDILTDDENDPAILYEADDTIKKRLGALSNALNVLDDRSREVIQRRFLDEGKTTLAMIAKDLGVSIERVRQIESSALSKMRSVIAA